MFETITRRVSLVGQVIEDLTYEALGPRQFSAELVGVGKSPHYKLGGFFVFSGVSSGDYTLRISGKRFQTMECSVTVPPTDLPLDPPGNNELLVIVTGIDSEKQRIAFGGTLLNREIRAGAPVWALGFSGVLATRLDVGRITRAGLDSVVGLAVGSIVRIRRDPSVRLKFDPYYPFPSGITRISGKVVSGALPDAPSLTGVQIRLTEIDGSDVVLSNIEGANIAIVDMDGTQTILGAEKDVTTLTNQAGDYILYFGDENLPRDFANMTLEATLAGYRSAAQTTPVVRGQRNTVNLNLGKI